MTNRHVTIPARDGFKLRATVHMPEGPEAAVAGIVLMNSATAVRRKFYNRFCEFLAENGFVAINYDYRGIGESLAGSLRGFPASARDWANLDYGGVLDWSASEFGRRKTACIGHSIGGQIIGLQPSSRDLTAIVTIAAQSGYWGNWPFPNRYAYAALWYLVMPATTRAVGYFPGKQLGLGEHLPHGVALEWARWARAPEYFVDERGHPLDHHFDEVRAEILRFWIDDDRFAPRKSVEALHRRFVNARILTRDIEARSARKRPIGHFGFFRESLGGEFWPDVAGFLKEKLT